MGFGLFARQKPTRPCHFYMADTHHFYMAIFTDDNRGHWERPHDADAVVQDELGQTFVASGTHRKDSPGETRFVDRTQKRLAAGTLGA